MASSRSLMTACLCFAVPQAGYFQGTITNAARCSLGFMAPRPKRAFSLCEQFSVARPYGPLPPNNLISRKFFRVVERPADKSIRRYKQVGVFWPSRFPQRVVTVVQYLILPIGPRLFVKTRRWQWGSNLGRARLYAHWLVCRLTWQIPIHR